LTKHDQYIRRQMANDDKGTKAKSHVSDRSQAESDQTRDGIQASIDRKR
jgi:hypothetical protein